MSGDGKVYIAPVDGGDWTEIGYVTDAEVSDPAVVDAVLPTWTSRSIEFRCDAASDARSFLGWLEHGLAEYLDATADYYDPLTDAATRRPSRPRLTLRPDDGRDQPRLPDMSNLKLPAQPGERIAAVTPGSYMFSGVYRPCGTCHAPAMSPKFPPDWRLDFAVDGGRVWMTPHRDTCTASVVGVPLKAEYVHNLTLDLNA